jgi:ubiquinone/menaquinone biosynthesis C-methylase UbiE
MTRSIDRDERVWQDERGGTLQEEAYVRSGTREVHHAQFARIAAAAALLPQMRLLDIGCGIGHFLGWMEAHARARFDGLDISLASLRQARAHLPALGWTAGSAEFLPYDNCSFDRIVCNGSAHHIVNKRAAFMEMHRVMAPGGRLILHEPAATPFTTAIRSVFVRSSKYESPVDLAHKEEFTARSAEVILREAGFTEFEHSRHDFLAYPLSGNYFRTPWSGSRLLMRFLVRAEGVMATVPVLKALFAVFSWRTLLVCTKPNVAAPSRDGPTV